MHPRVFLDSFWRNDIANEVFVAMSFDARYEARWNNIFRPAIECEPFGQLVLKAVRVDIRRSGDSILTEINHGIAHSQLVLADISVTDRWSTDSGERWLRNGNVMYEVGIALACRQPVEVILIRDDSEHLLFDVSHIPVLTFDPSQADASAKMIRSAIADRLRERDLRKDLRVNQIVESLSQFEVNLIRTNAHLNVLGWKGPSLPAAVAMALPPILNKRILRLVRAGENDEPVVYAWTTLGRVVANILTVQRTPTP